MVIYWQFRPLVAFVVRVAGGDGEELRGAINRIRKN
jgi:hypothetical protein